MVNVLIVTHGGFGGYLLEAAEGIVGPQREGVGFLGLSSRSPVAEVREKIRDKVRALRGAGGLLVMADMIGGTPMNLTLPEIKDLDDVELITGVNLYMVVSALTHRSRLDLKALTEKALNDARRSCADVKSMLRAKVN